MTVAMTVALTAPIGRVTQVMARYSTVLTAPITANAKASGTRRRTRSVSVRAEGIRQPYGEEDGDAGYNGRGDSDVTGGGPCWPVPRRRSPAGAARALGPPGGRGTRSGGTTRSGTACRTRTR